MRRTRRIRTGTGFNEYGDEHQLKMVIMPEQVEWHAQKMVEDDSATLSIL